METGAAGEPAGYPPGTVGAAADKLLRRGWWSLDQKERSAISVLVRAGLTVGVNPDFEGLGLNPMLVTAKVRHKESFRDVAGDSAYTIRSYNSSSLFSVALAAPPVPPPEYLGFWKSKERDGALSDVKVHPLEDIRFLMAQVEAFDPRSGTFEFSWGRLPARRGGGPPPAGGRTPEPSEVAVVNGLMRDPMVESLEALSSTVGVGLAEAARGSKLVREFPLGWGFGGPEPGRHAGLILLYDGLTEGAFGPLRASIRDVPYAALEAWGPERPGGKGRVYFAELVVPAETLAEATDYVRRVSASCAEELTYGFYDPAYLERHQLLGARPHGA